MMKKRSSMKYFDENVTKWRKSTDFKKRKNRKRKAPIVKLTIERLVVISLWRSGSHRIDHDKIYPMATLSSSGDDYRPPKFQFDNEQNFVLFILWFSPFLKYVFFVDFSIIFSIFSPKFISDGFSAHPFKVFVIICFWWNEGKVINPAKRKEKMIMAREGKVGTLLEIRVWNGGKVKDQALMKVRVSAVIMEAPPLIRRRVHNDYLYRWWALHTPLPIP